MWSWLSGNLGKTALRLTEMNRMCFVEESDGVSSTQTTVGSDTDEDTQNTTVLVQMEEEERDIRVMPLVTTLSFVRAVKGKAEG